MSGERPRIVCLCGLTRFYDAFQRANYDETMAGRIVLSVGFYPHSANQAHGETVGIPPDEFDAVKARLDVLHLRKIDLADEVLVLNCRQPWCDHCGRFTSALYLEGQNAYAEWCSKCGLFVDWRPYVGDSTRREIAYAQSLGKPVRYLEGTGEGGLSP